MGGAISMMVQGKNWLVRRVSEVAVLNIFDVAPCDSYLVSAVWVYPYMCGGEGGPCTLQPPVGVARMAI